MLGGVALQALVEARTAGVIAAIGVSASNPVDAPAALDDPDVDIVQVATSILDQRLVRNGFFDTAAAKGKRVHVRSVFLQGAALLEPDDLPEYLSELRRPIAGLRAEARVLGTSVEAICLAYVRNLPIEGIIVGCETVQQAAGNFRAWTQDISPEDLTRIVKSIPDLPEEALTPARWGA